MRRLAILLVFVMLVASIGVAAVLSSREGQDPATRPSGVLPTFPPGSPGASPITVPGEPTGFAFGPANSPSPNDSAAQSRLWFHDEAWWGVFLTSQTADQRIFRLDATTLAWIDTGVAVDDRAFARMDVVWDGRRLVVAASGPRPDERHALRITRFRYDTASREYRRSANFPVAITAGGVEDVTVARAADGRLWVSYFESGQLVLDHSLDSDLMWRGAFVPDLVSGSVDAAAIASVGGFVALVWTPTSDDAVHIAWHDPAGLPDVWQGGSAAPVAGLRLGEDQLGMAVDRSPGVERLLIGVRSGADQDPNRGRLDPQVVLIEFRRDAEPITYLVGRVQDQLGGPTLVIDGDARQIHLFMPAPAAGGTIYHKMASLDGLQFATGQGTPLFPSAASIAEFRSPTSTKQSVDRGSGLVVAATDAAAGRWGFGSLGVVNSGANPSATPDDTDLLVNFTFNGLAAGAAVPGWEVDGEPAPAFTIESLTGSDSSARLAATIGDARTCTRFAVVEADMLRAGTKALFNAPSTGDMKLLQLRGRGGEAASIRLREGEVVYADGDARVRSGLVLAPGRWYRALLALDLTARTYDVQIRDAVDGAILLEDTGLAWPGDVATVDQVCAELSSQPGLELYLDDVRVRSTGEDED